jgi:hypothetical protein
MKPLKKTLLPLVPQRLLTKPKKTLLKELQLLVLLPARMKKTMGNIKSHVSLI